MEDIGSIIGIVLYFAFIIFVIAGIWKMHVKAGQPGWAVIVPIYNFVVLLKIAGKPVWWIFLLLIPLVQIFVLVKVGIAVAHNFEKSTGFGWGIALLGFIFMPILGFGDAKYQGVKAS